MIAVGSSSGLGGFGGKIRILGLGTQGFFDRVNHSTGRSVAFFVPQIGDGLDRRGECAALLGKYFTVPGHPKTVSYTHLV